MATLSSTVPAAPLKLPLNMMNVPPQSLDNPPVKNSVVPQSCSVISSEIMLALEIARDNPEAASHGTIGDMLESALAGIWGRVLADESGYVMSRDEFAIFNFFQDRFQNNPVAKKARARFWDNLRVPASNTQNV
ncbi:hypothetical protein NUW58_g5345 [Xylaria curta]|uniref:Uncharacterized protein n=1 Tax=Xylaria curta TaxID=42375 RepID=A0ACC1P4H7_9PEZI|nr:hypothetical protein NUW58_g5345 [Xylaria curta]